MDNYVALVIDIKKSRSYSIENRNEIQSFIISVNQKLNQVFESTILHKVDFSAGDEVQGLFKCPEAAYLYYRLFSMLIYPVEVRAGIGVGEWNIRVNNASTTAQDGPVYHNARKAIENVKNSQGYSILIYSSGENDIFINSAINMPFLLVSNRSDYQNEIMLLTELLFPINFRNAIDESKINCVSEIIKLKMKLKYYADLKKSKSINKRYYEEVDAYLTYTSSTDAIEEENNFFISSGKKKGMTMTLSNILGVSRQSIEKTYKTTKIYEVRNSTILALKLLNKYFQGDLL